MKIPTLVAVLFALSSLASAQVYNGSTWKYGGHTYTWEVGAADSNGNCNARCSDEAGYTTGWMVGTAGAASAQGVPSVTNTDPKEMKNVGTGEGDPNGKREVDVSKGESYGATNGGVFITMRPAAKEKGRTGSGKSPITAGPGFIGRGDDVETTPGR